METFSALLAICVWGNSPVTGEFPPQRPVTRNFDVFFDLRLNTRLSKQSWGWWFETPSRPSWRQCNGFETWSHQSESSSLWRHRIETFSALLALCQGNLPVTTEFPSQWDSNADLWCSFVVILNKLLNKHSIDRYFETSWQTFDVAVMLSPRQLSSFDSKSLSCVRLQCKPNNKYVNTLWLE